MSSPKDFSPVQLQSLISFYFNPHFSLEESINTIRGLSKQINLDFEEEFYWMEPSLNLDEKDLRQVLSNPRYELNKEIIEKYISNYKQKIIS